MANSGVVNRRLTAGRGPDGCTDIHTAQGQMVFTVPVESVYR
jgi:hypothetical protein